MDWYSTLAHFRWEIEQDRLLMVETKGRGVFFVDREDVDGTEITPEFVQHFQNRARELGAPEKIMSDLEPVSVVEDIATFVEKAKSYYNENHVTFSEFLRRHGERTNDESTFTP